MIFLPIFRKGFVTKPVILPAMPSIFFKIHTLIFTTNLLRRKNTVSCQNNTTNGKSPDHTVILLIQHQKNRSSA